MNIIASPSSAEVIDASILKVALTQSRFRAIEQAGRRELAVRDVGDLQREKLRELLYGKAKGTDGVAEKTGDMELPPEAEQVIRNEEEQRLQALRGAEDATVFERTDEMAAFQDEQTRGIGIGNDALLNLKDLERRKEHELAHTKQETGNQVAQILETGVSVIDKQKGKMERLTFREDGAMKAEKKVADVDDHVPLYKGYQKISAATAEYLNEAEMNGDELVQAAANTKDGFRRLQQAMIMATVRKRIKEAKAEVPVIAI